MKNQAHNTLCISTISALCAISTRRFYDTIGSTHWLKIARKSLIEKTRQSLFAFLAKPLQFDDFFDQEFPNSNFEQI